MNGNAVETKQQKCLWFRQNVDLYRYISADCSQKMKGGEEMKTLRKPAMEVLELIECYDIEDMYPERKTFADWLQEAYEEWQSRTDCHGFD